MPPTKDTPSVLAAGFELIKQYPGEEQVRLKVMVEIPGSWFGSGGAGSLNAGERAEKYQAQATEFAQVHEFKKARATGRRRRSQRHLDATPLASSSSGSDEESDDADADEGEADDSI